MTTTTYYELNIVEGTDIVNPLIVDNPNYAKIDETMHNNAVAGVTLATEIANATVHAITRENSDCAVIRFIATSKWKAGDSVTVDGVPVTALLPSGETLPDGAYVINANVLCVLTGTNLTVYVEGNKTQNANDIKFNDTTVGAELVRQDGEIVRLDGEIVKLDGEIDNVNLNLKYVKLWNNPNSNIDFPAQTLALDLSSYDYIDIDFKLTGSINNSHETKRYYKGSESNSYFYFSGIQTSRAVNMTDSGIVFGDGYNSSNIENIRLVPCAIYAGKVSI